MKDESAKLTEMIYLHKYVTGTCVFVLYTCNRPTSVVLSGLQYMEVECMFLG